MRVTRDCKYKRTSKTCKLAKQRAYSRILVKHEGTGKYPVNFKHALSTRDREKLFETRQLPYSYPNSEIGLDSGWKIGKVVHPSDLN